MHLSSRGNQSGDTIVEVLIAMSVVGMVLVGAFASANASLKQVLAAQERGQAQKYAQSTIERLHAAVRTSPILSGTGDPGTFCINSSNSYVNNPNSDECKPDGPDGLFKTAVTRTDATREPVTYTVTVSWVGLGGANEHVGVNYRTGRPKLDP